MSDHTSTPQSSVDDAMRSKPAASTASGVVPAGRTIECEMRTTASPEQAWAAWGDPEKISQWFVDRAFGDVRPGGVMTWIFEKFNYEIPYPVLEATSPERFVLGGELPGRPPFRLEITITRDGGETVVRLFNSGFRDGAEWEDEYQGVSSGWRTSLALLKYYLEHNFGTPKRSFLAMRPATFSYDSIRPWFTDRVKLAQWLTTDGAVGAPGSPYELRLQSGETVRGTVLEDTGHEFTMSWDAENVVLELKAFAAGPGKMVAIRVTGWDIDEARLHALETSCEAAVTRLASALG